MGRDLFLVVLAALTAVCGIALLVMIRRRRAEASRRERLETEKSVETDRDDAAEPRRLIDDYAIPVSFDDAQDDKDDEPDISKICPSCGRRYGSHHRICERDNSELAALN
jgi:hypothetical protein